MAGITVDIRANAQAYEQAMQRLGQLHDRYEKRLRATGQTSSRVGRQEIELNRAKARVLRELETPQDRHNQKIGELDRLLKANKISQDQYNQAARNAKTELDGAAQSGESAFGMKALGMVRNLAGAMGLAGGLAGAVQLVRQEWEAMERAQRASFDLSVQMAGAQEGAHLMLGLTTQEEREEFDTAVMAMAGAAGVGPSEVYRRAGDVLSARGTLGWQDAMPALEASFAASPGDGTVGRRFAGAALDLRRAGMDPEAAMGFVMQSGEMARPTETAKIAETVPQVAAAGMAYGAPPEFGAAMWAAMTHAATDVTGDISRTAVINMLERLDEFEFPGAKPTSAVEALAQLQADPELAEAFIEKGGYGGRAQAQVGMRSIIRGEEHATAMQETMAALTASAPQRSELFQETAAARAAAPAQQMASLDRELGGLIERAGVGRNLEEQVLAGIRKHYDSVLEQAGLGRMERTVARWDVGWLSESPSRWREVIEERAATFEPGGGRAHLDDADQFRETLQQFAQVIERYEQLIAKEEHATAAQERAAVQLGRNAGGGPTLAPLNDD